MKVEIILSEEIKEPYAVIHTDVITDEIRKISTILQSKETLITAFSEDKIVIINPSDIYMIRVENSETVLYLDKRKLISKKRLYELEELLGIDFMRISKTTLINLKKMECVEPGFNGMMLLILKNGAREYISRKYLLEFKKYLGL